jgi:hypothetical protein
MIMAFSGFTRYLHYAINVIRLAALNLYLDSAVTNFDAAKWGAPLTFTVAGIVCVLVLLIAMLLGYGKREAHTH